MQYGVIGKTLKHSFSKEIHSYLADYDYEICELAENELAPFFQKRDFCAVNVTIPYKKDVIEHLDFVSDIAQRLDSVNTIVNKGGKLYGYNTDYFGLKALLAKNSIAVAGKKVLVLGTGGTARTAHLLSTDLGAKEVLLVSRHKSNDSISYDEAKTNHSDAEIIINATPCGMYPENYSSPIDISGFKNLKGVIDAIYNPLSSELVLDAKERNIPSEGGLYMLVAQAVFAVEFFLDTKIEQDKVNAVFSKINSQKENIVLVGMPASGKSTVGKVLADTLGRELFDTDTEILKRIGMPIAEFFKKHGEESFRKIESEVIRELAKKTGIIIATGGGAVLDHTNVRALRSNGKLYFLDRALALLLPTEDRPLSRSREDIEELYKKRLPIYLSASDIKIDANGTPKEVAENIRKDFYAR